MPNILLPSTLHQPFKAVLFDLDGTLLDSEGLHYGAFKQAMQEYGYDFDAIAKNMHYQGSFKKLFKDIGHELAFDEAKFDTIYARKVELTLAAAGTESDKVEGIISFLELLLEKSIPLAVVTNSERAYADYVLQAHDLLPYFQHVITGNDVAEPKPSPEGYLQAAGLFNIDPADILVFENSDAGIAAGKAAGMKVIAIQSTDVAGVSTFAEADLGIDSFADTAIDDLMFHV